MPTFAYKAIDRAGNSANGTLDAADRKGALRSLSAQGLRPTFIELKQDAASASQAGMDSAQDAFGHDEAAAKKKRFKLFGSAKSRSSVALSFLENLLMLIQSGLPMGDALRLLYNRVGDEDQKELASALWKRISEGRTLSGSMQDFPLYFKESQIQLVAAGEASGRLGVVLERVVEYMRESAEARRKFTAGIAYPMFIVSMALVIVVFFLLFLLPIVRKLLQAMGGDMQFFAKVLIGGGQALVYGGPWIIAAVLIAVAMISNWRKTQLGRAKTDAWMLRLPIFSGIYQHQHILQTSILLSTLMESGINTPEALRLVERTVSNTVLRGAYSAIRRMIQEGISLSGAIRKVRIMPDIDVDILSVGENTGTISGSLKRIYEIHRAALNKSMSVLMVVLTSGALFVAFAIVAMIALSIVMSVLDISHTLSTH
ncbi:MAG: type II secretion system F family protein [Opitutales bacterium]|nr:type II secretion system F family protein [Opitutales bacterium]